MHVVPSYGQHLAAHGNEPGAQQGRVLVQIPGPPVTTLFECDSAKLSALIEAGSYIGVSAELDDGSRMTVFGPVIVRDAPKDPAPAAPTMAPAVSSYGSLADLAGGAN